MLKLRMYLRIVTGALLKRKSRVAIALVALIIGSGVISALLSVYYDINQKMGKELRTYGANFILIPKASEELENENVQKILTSFKKEQILGYSPYLYGLAVVKNMKLVVAGIAFDQISKVTPYWQIEGATMEELKTEQGVLVGYNAATKTKLKPGKIVTITEPVSGKSLKAEVLGIIKTGGIEDNQVFIDFSQAQSLYDKKGKANVVYFSLLGEGTELNKQALSINKVLEKSELKTIKQISQSESKIMEKIKGLVYLVVIIILLSTMLCVATTMMSMVIERRKEIGLRKALGAKNSSVVFEFLGEGLVLGGAGGFLGAILGLGLAQIIGQSVFNSYISFRMVVPIMVTVVSLMVTSLACLIPLWTATKVQPAIILKEN